MTRVCLVGDEDVTLRYELLSRETSREALSTYDLSQPFENSIALETVSLGAAMALCNDLQWYVVRFVESVLVREPSVSEREWLSHRLAQAIRSDELHPDETDEYLKIYGLETAEDRATANEPPAGVDPALAAASGSGSAEATGDGDRAESQGATADSAPTREGPPRLVEPLYVRRTDGEIPEYDLRDVSDTVVVRLTEDEYAP
ncbi:DUF5804 family protein [Halovivax limisalsi]|uniref:DUF5804 family protein n=1 Tax=Halovivax limisalsi TaxID=1453760 RepID=UPI001FFDDBBE|nr:DUF5804 family protein [Halovivax limisalsi]